MVLGGHPLIEEALNLKEGLNASLTYLRAHPALSEFLGPVLQEVGLEPQMVLAAAPLAPADDASVEAIRRLVHPCLADAAPGELPLPVICPL